MKVAIVAAEMAPHAKVGGLADMIASLPPALARRGAQVCVILPGYRALLESIPTESIAGEFGLRLGTELSGFGLRSGIGDRGVPLFFIEHHDFFSRYGIYGGDYYDNLRRYIFFAKAAVKAAAQAIKPDVIHAHDWHAGAAPIVMRADPALRERLEGCISVLTIHNVAFQGRGPADYFDLLNIDRRYFSIDGAEFYGQLNLLKGGAAMADAVTTVSPTYAREICNDPALGEGLEGVLRARGDAFSGILNGVDYSLWDPATDRRIVANYTPDDPSGKRRCKEDLRARLNLPPAVRPLVGMVSRLTTQKGFDLLLDAMEGIMQLDLDLVILGSGDYWIEQGLQAAQRRHGSKLRLMTGYDENLSHGIQAACDIFLMPSRFEPCGLTQMYALKYGSAPVVRATGGLADTVAEYNPSTGSGNGFRFEPYESASLLAALAKALEVWHDAAAWSRLMRNCFAADFSSDYTACQYLELFHRVRRQS